MIPDPTAVHPTPRLPWVVFLRPLVAGMAHIEVGEFTYYQDRENPTEFATRNVLYAYGPERLVIGRYCCVARGTRFLMSGANHPMSGAGTFPFGMFGGDWWDATHDILEALPSRGDTVIGNNVWFGLDSLIMPGIRIGDGAIIASGSVVTSDVPPYTIVGGNPARVIQRRFSEPDIEELLRIAWWDWPVEAVTAHARAILTGSVADLSAAAEKVHATRTDPTP